MYRQRGVSQTVAALAVLVIILAAAASYGLLRSPGTNTTTSTVSTTITGTGSTVTSTATSVSTSTATSVSTKTSTATSVSTSTATTTTTATSTLTQIQDIATAAQAECASAGSNCLTILTTQSATNWANCYGPAFDQAYPWATGKVTYTSMSTAALTTSLISNFQAHSVQADIATGTLAGLEPALSNSGGGTDTVINYTSPQLALMNYSSSAYGPNWITTNIAIVHMIYNPSVMKADNLPIPTSWTQLSNPVYKNQIAIQTATALGITTAEFYYLSTTMSNSTWTTLMQGIAANNPKIEQTAGNAEQDVISGQDAIGIATFDDYVSDIKGGTPSSQLAFDDIEPIVYTPGVVTITAGAPHPNMAKLFEAWYISIPGQLGVLCTNHDPYQSQLSTNLESYLPSDYRLVNAYANTALLSDTANWSQLFKNIFGA